uniref:Protein containing P-loop NTPase and MMR-HSR1 domain n=1 Tax=Rhipicephalus zambeziensis TaxID=60191 RepID=A0A224Z6R6_9ACAR
MNSRAKQRNAANSAESATLTVNERILRDCHMLYVDPDNGLVKIAESLGQTLLPPRKKIVVLLIGNHSAGKSTFINWYIEEHVQKTGVAIETQGFALVTSGKKRESLTGNATLHLYPHFKPLQKIKGVVDYLTTEISTSRQKRFSLVTFIDTPGLVDGDMKYPYDVNKTILWLGQMADLIFVFFDPIGQALCKRTLNIVEELNDRFVDKMRFYLSKADEAGHEADRQKVMMQIVQELCKRPGLNRCGFDMPAIYIPDASKQAVRCVNQIEEVCKDIEKTINQTVQNALNSLEHDCEQLSSEVSLRISRDNNARSENLSTGGRGLCLGLFGLALPSLLLLNLALRNAPEELLFSYLGPGVVEFLYLFTLPLQILSGMLPDSIRLGVMLALFAVSIFILLIAKWQSRLKPILTRQEKRTLLEAQSYLRDYVKPKKQRLYEEYLRQSVADYDL